MQKQDQQARDGQAKRPYVAPEVVDYGTVEKITGWVGGPWGEFFGGIGTGWNPWQQPGTS